MLGNVALYASKKRKKPVQKMPKALPPDAVKSNPSKRHRDRLNGELDKLTSLLPFSDEVRARLDKLSVLRLSVGYLKVKSFFTATMKKGPNCSSWTSGRSLPPAGQTASSLTAAPSRPFTSFCSMVTSIDGVSFSEGDLLLQALNGFVLVVTAEGYIFYTSPTIQEYLGFHQSDVVHQSVFELIHTDDRGLFRGQLHFALNSNSGKGQFGSTPDSQKQQNSTDVISGIMTYDPQLLPPENSSFLERSFVCRFRCLLDNSSGFLALNFRGRLKYIHGQNKVSDDDDSRLHQQLALFAVATPVQPPTILEIRTKTLIFQTKHKLDFAPMGIDPKGKVVLGYSEKELCMKGSGYHFIHAADMMYCADNHLRMIKTGHSGMTVFRLLTKAGIWVWVQSNAALINKDGRPDFIVATQRALTNEEGEEHLRLRRLQLPFNFATGEAVLYDMSPTLDVPDPCSGPKQHKVDSDSVDPDSLLGCMLRQDQAVYCQDSDASALNDMFFKDTHALVSVPGDAWQQSVGGPGAPGLVKPEGTLQDMTDTLREILGDTGLSSRVDVEPEELKEWEDTLLQVSNGCQVDLDEMLSNDILSYVEEQLLKEGGLPMSWANTLDLQDQTASPGAEQGLSWPAHQQVQPPPNGGRLVAESVAVGSASMGLAGFNGPTLQQIASQNTHCAGLHSGYSPSYPTPPVNFNPPARDSCAQVQRQLAPSQISGRNNSLGLYSYRPVLPNQIHPNQNAQPIKNHIHRRLTDMASALPEQSPATLSCPSAQWISPKPGSNQTPCSAEPYSQNISNLADFNGASSYYSGVQGSFSLQTQNRGGQGTGWPQHEHQLPIRTPNGHQNPAQTQTPQLQQNSLSQISGNPALTYRSLEMTGVSFPVQQETPQPVPSSSCMLGGSAPLVPHMSQVYQGSALPSCQRINSSSNPRDGDVGPMTDHQVVPSMPQDSVQPYIIFSQQTQIKNRPILGNGVLPFASLSNGNTYYSDSK